MVDMPVRNQDALQVRNVQRFAKLVAHGGDALHQMVVAAAIGRAGIDERWHTYVEYHIAKGDEAGKHLDRQAVNPRARAGCETLNRRKLAHHAAFLSYRD